MSKSQFTLKKKRSILAFVPNLLLSIDSLLIILAQEKQTPREEQKKIESHIKELQEIMANIYNITPKQI